MHQWHITVSPSHVRLSMGVGLLVLSWLAVNDLLIEIAEIRMKHLQPLEGAGVFMSALPDSEIN